MELSQGEPPNVRVIDVIATGLNNSGSFSWSVSSLISEGDYSIIIADAAGDNNKSEPFTIISAVQGITVAQPTEIGTSSQSAQITSISTTSSSSRTTSTAIGGQMMSSSNLGIPASGTSNPTPTVAVVAEKSSNVGSIVGGVVGGVAVLALMMGVGYLIHRQ